MKVTAYKIIMTIHGENAEGPVDLDREFIVVGISQEDAVQRIKERYEKSLEALLSSREPLSFYATVDINDIIDVSPNPLKAVAPREPIELVSPTMPADYSEFWRQIPTDMTKVKGLTDKGAEPGVRLYCYSFGRSWRLQVRGRLALANGGSSETFIVAGAHMTADDLRALRDGCQIELTRCEEAG